MLPNRKVINKSGDIEDAVREVCKSGEDREAIEDIAYPISAEKRGQKR